MHKAPPAQGQEGLFLLEEDMIRKELIKIFIDRFCMEQIERNIPLKDTLNSVEKMLIERVLSACQGNRQKTEKCLSLKTSTLHEKIKRFNIRTIKLPVLNEPTD